MGHQIEMAGPTSDGISLLFHTYWYLGLIPGSRIIPGDAGDKTTTQLYAR